MNGKRILEVKLIEMNDECHGAPWEEHDGHGIVSDWTTRAKLPGERVLVSDRNSKRYYDVQGTMVIALRDGWGPMIEGKTRRESAALAVDRDYENLRAWCNDEWHWIGIRAVAQVTLDTNGVIQHLSSGGLWGIESDSDKAYFAEVAAEELADLKSTLEAAGFSKRAIATACKGVTL